MTDPGNWSPPGGASPGPLRPAHPPAPVLTQPMRPVPTAPPPRSSPRTVVRVDPVPGTPFAVGYLDVPPVYSGLAIGSLVAGIAGLLVFGITACLGLLGAQDGWGILVAGAFAVPSALLGGAGIGLGLVGLRQIRQAAPTTRIVGRGLAISGLVCGVAGIALTVSVLALVAAI